MSDIHSLLVAECLGMCGVLFCHDTFVKRGFLSFGTLFASVLMRASCMAGGTASETLIYNQDKL